MAPNRTHINNETRPSNVRVKPYFIPQNKDRLSNPTRKKRDKWTPQENAKLIQLRQSGLSWKSVAAQLPGRNLVNCMMRYRKIVPNLPPFVRIDDIWTPAQDEQLLRLWFGMVDIDQIAQIMGKPLHKCNKRRLDLAGEYEHEQAEIYRTVMEEHMMKEDKVKAESE